MDMIFHWLRDRMNQLQFRFHWRPGLTHTSDYWTKYHTAAHHTNFRREILTPVKLVENFSGQETISCEGMLNPIGIDNCPLHIEGQENKLP